MANKWTGLGADDEWTDAANWSLGHVPLAAESIVIPPNYTVDITSEVTAANNFMEGKGATLDISSGASLNLSGVATIGGAVSGAGTMYLTGSATFAGAAALTVAQVSISEGVLTSIDENLNYAGNLILAPAPTLAIDAGYTLQLTGKVYLAGTVSGAGELALAGGGYTTIDSGAAFTVADWSITGSGTTTMIFGSLSYGGKFTLGAGAKLGIMLGDTVSLTASATLDGVITDLGTLALSATSTATVANDASDYGGFTTASGSTLNISSGDTMTLAGTAFLAGNIDGAGALNITGSATLAQGAGVTSADVSNPANNLVKVGHLSLTGDGTTSILGNGAIEDCKLSLGAAHTIAIGADDELLLEEGHTYVAGTVSGAGTLSQYSDQMTIASGASLTVADWTLVGNDNVDVWADLTYAGNFDMEASGITSGQDRLALYGGDLTLQGDGAFNGVDLTGAHILRTEGTTALNNELTIERTAEWDNTGTVTAGPNGNYGAFVSLGSGATLINESTGVFDFGYGIQGSAYGKVINDGLFEAAPYSFVTAPVDNDGTILASGSATDITGDITLPYPKALYLENAITGTGAVTISGAATVEFESSVSLNQKIDFSGDGGTLAISSLETFSSSSTQSAKISGFGGADTISVIGAWKMTGFTENADHSAASLNFVGEYQSSEHATLSLMGDYTGFNAVYHNAPGTNTIASVSITTS